MSPSTRAFSMAVPDTPKTSVATLDNLQQLERPIALGRQGLGKGSPMAQEITQLTDLRRRHEARSDQAVAHQVSNPFGILHVSLAPWHRLDVVGIGNDHGEEPFEDGVDRLPIDAGALHADMR